MRHPLPSYALLASQRSLSELRRILDARSSLVAGEVAFRPRKELGYAGLAQKEGFQTAEKLVQATTGSTRRDASTLVTAGTLVHESLILEAARAIKSGLGDPSVGEPFEDGTGTRVSADDLAAAATRLIAEAGRLNADAIVKLARQLRDELDASGVASGGHGLGQGHP